MMRTALIALVSTGLLIASCATNSGTAKPTGVTGGSAGAGGVSTGGGGVTGTGGIVDGGPAIDVDVPDSDIIPDAGRDPETCDEAIANRTYLGCEYWPTVVGNVVSSSFHFAVIVANGGMEDADVQVTGPNGFSTSATVAPNGLATIYLPWVSELKGPSLVIDCTMSGVFTESVLSPGGAYRLVSSRPVAAYQFNPLEFYATGGPVDADWNCTPGERPNDCECNSYSNDASLLLPVNALTGNYRGFTWRDQGDPSRSKPVYLTITAVQDDTEVNVKLGASASIIAGPVGSGIPAAGPGEIFTLTMNQGDVAELIAAAGSDLSGTEIQTTKINDEQKPIQVIAGSPSARVPNDTVFSSDHVEEMVFPAETLGMDYVVTQPSAPSGLPAQHAVRIYGHVDGTELSYYPAAPDGAPASIDAGGVVELGAVTADFQVQGSEPFAVASFLVGTQLLDPTGQVGDPSQSFVTSLPQYRAKYVFLAPVDFKANFANIVAEAGTVITIDGTALGDAQRSASFVGKDPDGAADTTLEVYRVLLGGGPNGDGAHVLVASKPVGLQLVGYGEYTSYQYPGGLNLNLIAKPPLEIVPPK
jgi:hypothetical protein